MDAWVAGGSTPSAMHRLGAAFNEVRTGSPGARVVAIRAGSGAGRTGLLQAFYEYAAARQADPPYWPPRLTSVDIDPLAAREVIVPDEFEVAEGTRLPWLWWGLSGREEFAAAAGDTQLARHAAGLQAALADLDQITRSQIRFALDSLCLLGGLVPVLGPVIQAFDTVSAGAELVSRAGETFQRRSSRLDAALRTDARRRFAAREDAHSAAASDGRLLAQLTTVVPLVVVVDDADGLDDITLALLNTLVRTTGARVMCVLAINTDHHETHPSDVGIGDNEELHAVLAGLHTQGRLETIDLTPFNDTDLIVLARSELARWSQHDTTTLADVEPATLHRVVVAARGAPGRLTSLLTSRPVRQALYGVGTLPEHLDTLALRPATRDAWAALSVPARTALATLAVHGPTTLAHLLDPSILNAAAATGWTTTHHSPPAKSVVAFRAHALYAVADAYLSEQLTTDETAIERTRLRTELLTIAEADDWPTLPPDLSLSLLERLAATDPDNPSTLLAALLRMRRAAGLEASTPAHLERLAQTENLTGELLLITAEALADAGYQRRAVDLYTTEHDRVTSKYGPNDPRTLPALHNLAGAWAAYATCLPPTAATPAWGTVIELYTKLIDDYQQAMRKTGLTRRLPETREELARILSGLGRYQSALDTLKPAIKEYGHLLGDDHPQTLNTRSTLAGSYQGAERFTDAITLGEAVLADQVRVLEHDHPDTLFTRSNLASSYRGGGRTEDAITLGRAVVSDLLLVLGPDHPHTLATRSNLASSYKADGRTKDAITLYEAVLADQVRVLEPDHPDTLATRGNLASSYWADGRTKDAITLYEAVLADQVRVLEPDHPNTLATRNNLSRSYWYVGRATDAIALLEVVLAARKRLLGSDHPDTLISRNNLVRMYRDSRRTSDATALTREWGGQGPTAV